MLQRHGKVFDSAHNEYLQYLVTIGLLGLISYMTVLISLVVRCVRKCRDNSVLLIVIVVLTS